ncbi:MAG TPA: VacJ family lipoprotein [Burkholderiales bacterium]
MARAKRLCAALFLAGTLAGCATSGGNPADPFEPLNRAVFGFNDAADKAVIKPVAIAYRAVLPGFVRTGVSNFFSNIEDVWISVNDLLQGKFLQGVDDFGRFFFNSTFGIAGIFDLASGVGLPKHNEDFGQTLGSWGVGSGPYLVLPFLGPSTVRDGLAFLVDAEADPVWRINNVPVRNTAVAIRFVSRRAELLDATSLLDQAALDRYTFFRDAWLQRRRNLVYDGNPPREREEPDDEPTK